MKGSKACAAPAKSKAAGKKAPPFKAAAAKGKGGKGAKPALAAPMPFMQRGPATKFT